MILDLLGVGLNPLQSKCGYSLDRPFNGTLAIP